MAEIKSLTNKYDHQKRVSNGNKKEINQLKEACTTEVKRFRNEVDIILDDLERNILMELDNWEQNEDNHVDQNVSTFEATLYVLRVDCKHLEDAKRDEKKDAMFIADVQVSNAQTYQPKLGDLEKDIDKPTLAFEINELLYDFVTGINLFGSLKVQPKGHALVRPENVYSTNSTKILMDRKIKPCSEVNVNFDGDKESPIYLAVQ